MGAEAADPSALSSAASHVMTCSRQTSIRLHMSCSFAALLRLRLSSMYNTMMALYFVFRVQGAVWEPGA